MQRCKDLTSSSFTVLAVLYEIYLRFLIGPQEAQRRTDSCPPAAHVLIYSQHMFGKRVRRIRLRFHHSLRARAVNIPHSGMNIAYCFVLMLPSQAQQVND